MRVGRVPTTTSATTSMSTRRARVGRGGTTMRADALETSSGDARRERGERAMAGRGAVGRARATRATAALLVGIFANASFGVAFGVAADGTMVDSASEAVVSAAASAVASAVADAAARAAAQFGSPAK
jgi:hypothetical protein